MSTPREQIIGKLLDAKAEPGNTMHHTDVVLKWAEIDILIAALRAAEEAQKQEPVELARRFHDIYERLAPQFGYTTRKETREFNPDSPNGKLMIAVCAELAAAPAC